MSLYVDELANLIRQEVEENEATRADWEAAINQVFPNTEDTPVPDTIRNIAQTLSGIGPTISEAKGVERIFGEDITDAANTLNQIADNLEGKNT